MEGNNFEVMIFDMINNAIEEVRMNRFNTLNILWIKNFSRKEKSRL